MSIFNHYLRIAKGILFIGLIYPIIFNSQNAAFAINYWDALFEIGFDPEINEINSKAAYKNIERLIQLRKSTHEKADLNDELASIIHEIEPQIKTLDVGNLYDKLPYSNKHSKWRGVGIRGELTGGRYQLGTFDPKITIKENTSSDVTNYHRGPQNNFGEFSLRTLVRPTTQKNYRIKTKGNLNVDDIDLKNLGRIAKQLTKVACLNARGLNNLSINSFSSDTLDIQSLRVLRSLSDDFPNLFRLFRQYFTVKSIVQDRKNLITDTIYFDIVVGINVSAFKKDYPYLAAQIRNLENKLDYHFSLIDDRKRPILTMAFNGGSYQFFMRFKTQDGLFFDVTDKNTENGFDLTKIGHQKLYITQNLKVELAGLKINIEALKADLIYYYGDNTINLTFKLRDVPKNITVDGLALGILPIWLVDLFIPSNVSDMTQEFFSTLTSGNDGHGSYLRLGSKSYSTSTYDLRLKSDAEVMSNGTIKLAFNLQRKMFREKEKLLEDLSLFSQAIWGAFHLDFNRIKSLKDNTFVMK